MNLYENKNVIKQGKSLETCRQFSPAAAGFTPSTTCLTPVATGFAPAVTGLIPDSGIVENPGSKDGFILCGDAAGLCNPLTGAGIYNAIYSAKLASEIIIRSLILNDLGILQEIKEIYNSQFGNSINRALEKKLLQKNNWPQLLPGMNNRLGPSPNAHNRHSYDHRDSKDTIEFLDLIRQTWVSFRDYWR